MKTIVVRLEGACNQCGLCCTMAVNGTRVACEFLEITRVPGEPLATRCTVYDRRWQGMPIRMVDPEGLVVFDRGARIVCGVGSIGEALSILSRGIGKGCSLTPAFEEHDDGESDERVRLMLPEEVHETL